MSYNKVVTDIDNQRLRDIIKNRSPNITDKDIEAALQATDDIINHIENIQRANRQEQDTIVCCAKFVSILLLSIILLPFGITSTYYAYTDTSCVNLKAGKLYITLKDFLAVQGISLLASYVLIITMLCYGFNSLDSIKQYFQTPIMKLLTATNKTFSLAWLILGALIFWGLIDNNKCNDGLYNYMYASLIIMIIFTVINLYQIVKETK